MNLRRIELPRFNQLLDLRDRDLPGLRAEWIEVHGGGMEDKVAVPVALPGMDQSEIGIDGLLQHIVLSAEGAHLLRRRRDGDVTGVVVLLRQAAFAHLSTDTSRSVEGGDPGATGPQPLGQSALRCQLHLEFTRKVLAGELLVLPHIGADGPADPAVEQEDAEPPVVHPAVVADRLEIGGTLLVKRVDQGHRNTAEPKPAHGQRRTIGDIGHCLGGGRNNFVDHCNSLGTGGGVLLKTEFPGNQHQLNLGCAFAHLENLRVAVVT